MERETIYTEEVDMLLEGKSYADVIKYMDENDGNRLETRFKKYESEQPAESTEEQTTAAPVEGNEGENPSDK